MILITPTHSTEMPTSLAGGGLGVGTPKDVSASIPLYLERSVDIFAPQNTQAPQSYTATSKSPEELVAGFLDKNTGKFYQEVTQPFSTPRPNSLVATIQQPPYTQSVTAPASFKTVAYTNATPQAPSPKPVAPSVVRSAPVATQPAVAPMGEVVISDEVREAVAIIKELMEKPAIQKMVTTYQQEGARGLFHWSTVRRGLGLFSDAQVRQSVGELSRLLKSPDVQAAIKDPRVALGKDEALQELLDAFNGMGLIKANDETLETKPKRVVKKPAVVKAEAASDEDEDSVPAEASGGGVDTEELDTLIQELNANNADAPTATKRHTHKKQAATEE